MVQPATNRDETTIPPIAGTSPDSTIDTAKAAEIKKIAEVAATVAIKAAKDDKANKARADCERFLETPTPIFPDLTRRLEATAGSYNELTAFALSLAATWAYAEEPAIFSEVMSYLGINTENEYRVRIWAVHNDPFLVETTAIFVQTGRVGILCFRGTEPTNAMAWLSNMSFEMTRFHSWGHVHGGFHNGLNPLWTTIRGALNEAVLGTSAPRQYANLPPSYEKTSLSKVSNMEALFLCGHSLGGAHSVLAAAMLSEDPQSACIREKLRGIYTFGQPLVGDQEFSDACDKQFGSRLFRHIYGHDVVPHYPPRLYGTFRTPGQEYLSTPNGWTHRSALSARQTYTLIASTVLGAAAFVLEQIPVLREIRLPYSWNDHKPINYVRCSRLSLPFYK